MHIDPNTLGPSQAYRLLSGLVVPRPIAWVTTLSPSGVLNLAPFSCFSYVSHDPPMLGISIDRRGDRRKDTASHIHARGEYVVHIGDFSQLRAIHDSAVEHPEHVSEADLLGLRSAPSDVVLVPRLADAPVAMECRLSQVVSFGRSGGEFIVGEIVGFHLREGLMRDGKIDTLELDPACRVGGPNYARVGSMVSFA